jgi:predicted acyltransferase
MPVSARPIVRQRYGPRASSARTRCWLTSSCFLAAPLIDAQWLGTPEAPTTLRNAGQAWFSTLVEPRAASLLFALCGIGLIFLVLLVCHRRRWILKL